MLRSLILCLACCMPVGVVSAADEKPADKAPAEKADAKYEIRLHRPSKIGDQFRVEADGLIVRKMAITVGDQERPAVDERMGIGFDGAVKVLEIAGNGVETKLSVTLERCEARVFSPEGKSKSIPLLPRGTVLVAAWDKEKKSTSFTLDGEAVPEDIDELLELAVNASDPESQIDDEIFGSKESRPIGDSWSVNAVAAAKEFTRMGIRCKEEDIFGTTTLASKSEEGDTPSIQIRTEFKVRSLASDDKAEKKIRLLNGNLSIDTQVTMPVNVALPASKAAMQMKLVRNLAGKNEDGAEVHAVESVERQWERTIRPIGQK